MSASLRVGGLTPLTTIDFPGRLAAVVFLQGCPWRCGYCHNPGLLGADAPPQQPWSQVLAFLQRRQGLLDGVVFSGGEPTAQAGLAEAVAEVRALGFDVGLHTAGMYPERLAALLRRLAWVGLDIKGPWHRYDSITGVRGSGVKAQAALAQLLAAGAAHECRTTWHEGLFPLHELHALADTLAQQGVRRWALQGCRRDGRTQPPPPADELQRLGARFDSFCWR